MKSLCLALLLAFSPFVDLEAKGRTLTGKVVRVDQFIEVEGVLRVDPKPVANLELRMTRPVRTTRTSKAGVFVVTLPDSFVPGTPISFEADTKQDLRIYTPPGGKTLVPEDPFEAVPFELLPVRSKKFLSHPRLEQLFKDISEKVKQQVAPEGKPKDVDFSRYIKDWVAKYDLRAYDVEKEVAAWIREVKESDDPHKLGLALYAEKRFRAAAWSFGESGKLNEEVLKQRIIDLEEALRDTVDAYLLEGRSYYAAYGPGTCSNSRAILSTSNCTWTRLRSSRSDFPVNENLKALEEMSRDGLVEDVMLEVHTYGWSLRILAWIGWRTPVKYILKAFGYKSPYGRVVAVINTAKKPLPNNPRWETPDVKADEDS